MDSLRSKSYSYKHLRFCPAVHVKADRIKTFAATITQEMRYFSMA